MINEILKEYNNLRTILNRKELIDRITEYHLYFDDTLRQIVDNKLDYILENHHDMDPITNFNLNIRYNKEHFLQEQVFDNANHIKFVTEIIPVKVNVNTVQNISLPKSGIIEQSKYSRNIIRIRDIHLINLLKNLKK